MADVSQLVDAIVRIIGSSTSNENLRRNLNAKKNDPNLVPAIIAIITGAVQVGPDVKKKVLASAPQESLAEAILKIVRDALSTGKNIKTVLPENTRKNVEKTLNTSNSLKTNIVKIILNIIGNAASGTLKKSTAEKVVKFAGPPPQNANSITRLILEALKRNETPENAKKLEEEISKAPKPSTNNTANLIYKLITNMFKNKFPPPPKMPNGYNLSGDPNFFESKKTGLNGKPTFNIGIPGYVFRTGNRGTGYYRNTGPGIVFGPPGPKPPGPPPPARNYSGLNLQSLFNSLRRYPNNRNRINPLIRSKFESAVRNLRYASGATLYRRAAELLKILPMNYPGRAEIVNYVIDEIRRISRGSNLDAARRNLRNVRNRNVRDELEKKARNLRDRRREDERPVRENFERRRANFERRRDDFERRRENLERRRMSLRFPRNGETNAEYARRKAEYERNKEEANRQEMAMRREARMRAQPPPIRPNFPPVSGNVAPLPPLQQQAISNAGGINRAVGAIAAVPGGAPEVAKAAEALNETGGNVTQAIQVKGASPQAVQVVQKLGGVKNTVNVLEGLNTLSQTPETQRRKAVVKRTRRSKKSPRGIRLTELNRVIDAVKKQKLISLMAHNITRTNNIHPNDEKLKGYYKKVMKSYLLKKPFANIVKKAAKKNV